MEFATRKRLYNRCNPDEPLSPGDDRWVDLDAFGPAAPRGVRRAEALASVLLLSSRPTCQFLTGIAGSGISTELRRLAALAPKLLPVAIDAVEVIDPTAVIAVADLLVAVLGRTSNAVVTLGGRPSDIARFHRWIPGKPTSWTEALVELRHAVPSRMAFRSEVSAEFSRFIYDVQQELSNLDHEARRLGRDGIVVLFDSFEKLRGMSDTWTQVLASAERVFGADGSYLELPVHAVYTVPPALMLRLRSPVRVLPALRIADRAGQPDVGLDAARALVRARVPDDELDDALGANAREARVRRLIEGTGGLPGGIVRLVRDVIAQSPLDDSAFERLLSMAGEPYRRSIPESAYPWLARVSVEKALALPDDASRAIADRMLTDAAVVPYEDVAEWFDLHPALRSIPGIGPTNTRFSPVA